MIANVSFVEESMLEECKGSEALVGHYYSVLFSTVIVEPRIRVLSRF
jgi:hypothetical protein